MRVVSGQQQLEAGGSGLMMERGLVGGVTPR